MAKTLSNDEIDRAILRFVDGQSYCCSSDWLPLRSDMRELFESPDSGFEVREVAGALEFRCAL